MTKKAFTTLELIIVVLFFSLALIIFSFQKTQIKQKMRDNQRKSAINSLYFNLSEVYFKKNQYYPENLTVDTLEGVDPAIFSDPNKILLGDKNCDYQYVATDCQNNQCKKIKLTATLELEDKFVKSSR